MANELRYTLDTSTINYICRKCKQDDDRTLVLTLFDKNIPFPITGATLVLKAQRSNGTFVIQDTGLSILSNVVTITMIRDITRIAGQVKLELKITLASKAISTFTFMLDVVPSVIGDGDTKSANVMTALEDLDITIASAISTNTTLNTLNTTATATKSALNTLNTTALGTNTTLNNTNTTATNTNTALNNLNTTALGTKSALNTLNTTALGTNTTLNTLNTTANATKTALEVAIANGNTAAMKTKLDYVTTDATGITGLKTSGCTGSNGSIDISGSKSDYSGFYFTDMLQYFLVNATNQGIYNGASWTWQWSNGSLIAGSVPWARIPNATTIVNTLIDAKTPKWEEIWYTSLQNVLMGVDTLIVFGFPRNGGTIATCSSPCTELIISTPGHYIVTALTDLSSLTAGKSAKMTLTQNGITRRTNVQTDAFNEGSVMLEIVWPTQLSAGDKLSVRVKHNGTATAIPGSASLRIVKID